MKVAAISICALHEVEDALGLIEGTHLLSMLDHGTPMPASAHLPEEHHLRMFFRDTDDTRDPGAPTIEHMREILAWANGVPHEARLVVHCYMGISRSTAVTLGLLARSMPPDEAAGRLLEIRPQATPNRLIVSHWDEILGLDGALQDAAEAFPLPFWASDDWR